jgi:hypothetical protein
MVEMQGGVFGAVADSKVLLALLGQARPASTQGGDNPVDFRALA